MASSKLLCQPPNLKLAPTSNTLMRDWLNIFKARSGHVCHTNQPTNRPTNNHPAFKLTSPKLRGRRLFRNFESPSPQEEIEVLAFYVPVCFAEFCFVFFSLRICCVYVFSPTINASRQMWILFWCLRSLCSYPLDFGCFPAFSLTGRENKPNLDPPILYDFKTSRLYQADGEMKDVQNQARQKQDPCAQMAQVREHWKSP